MFEICEHREIGAKKLGKYVKVANHRNLNTVFGDFRLIQNELMIVYVNSTGKGEKKRIEYCTSNIERWLGKQK
jgi:hypothetical protein